MSLENDKKKREWKLEGIRLERSRVLEAFQKEGVKLGGNQEPQDIAAHLRSKLQIAKEYSADAMRHILEAHFAKHSCPCGGQLLMDFEDKMRGAPPAFSDPDEEIP